MHFLHLGLALACLGLATTAAAQPNPRSNVSLRGTVHPAPEYDPSYMRIRTGAFAAWKADEEKRMTTYSYRTVLRFAECVARFDRTAAPRVLHSLMSSSQSSSALTRMSETNRACAVQHSKVHPMLLRAALAETRLKDGSDGGTEPAGSQNPVGVPPMVDGYPLRLIANCQVRRAPQLVRDLLATEPGEKAEHDAAQALFARTYECGTTGLGRLTPTAARLALVDAEYTRRFVASSQSGR